MKLSSGFLGLLLLGVTGLASAQTMKPGLWEISTQMQGGSGDMSDAMAKAQKRMESMPPEQRKMVQDMMAKQGLQMGSAPGGGMSIKICMTQDMVNRNEFASHHSESQNDCTRSNSARSGNSMQFSFSCTNPPRSGEGQITFNSPDAYSMSMTTTSTIHGTPQKMSMQTNGHWLDSDCGTVKPRTMPSK